MRTLIVIPIVIAMLSAIGLAVCKGVGVEPHARELIGASVGCFMAAEFAMLPIILARHAGQAAVSQAALVGTMIHLFFCTAAAAAMMLNKSWQLNGAPLTGWFMSQYGVTLVILVIAFARAIKAAPPTVPAKS